MKMHSLTVKLLVALTCFTALPFSTEAEISSSCPVNVATILRIPGLHGKDGEPGIDGQEGPPAPQGPTGPPGALNYTEQQQLKEEILAMVREEIRMLNCYSATQPGLQCSGTSEDNPARPVRHSMNATPLLHLGTTGSTLPLDYKRCFVQQVCGGLICACLVKHSHSLHTLLV